MLQNAWCSIAHDAKYIRGTGACRRSAVHPVTLLPDPAPLPVSVPTAAFILRPVLPSGRENALRPTSAPPEHASSERHARVLR